MRVRAYETSDRDAVMALAVRLTCGVAPHRPPGQVLDAVRAWVETSLDGHDPVERPVFVATDACMGDVDWPSAAHPGDGGREPLGTGLLRCPRLRSGRGGPHPYARSARGWLTHVRKGLTR